MIFTDNLSPINRHWTHRKTWGNELYQFYLYFPTTNYAYTPIKVPFMILVVRCTKEGPTNIQRVLVYNKLSSVINMVATVPLIYYIQSCR